MPLISLIEDNLNFVLNLGIAACSLTGSDGIKNYSAISRLEFKIVYLTPEKLAASQAMKEIMRNLYQQGNIDRFVIDEVHCVSNWGQDFRKDYLKLNQLKVQYPKVPILGLTATATIKVKDDICNVLGIKNEVCF